DLRFFPPGLRLEVEYRRTDVPGERLPHKAIRDPRDRPRSPRVQLGPEVLAQRLIVDPDRQRDLLVRQTDAGHQFDRDAVLVARLERGPAASVFRGFPWFFSRHVLGF